MKRFCFIFPILLLAATVQANHWEPDPFQFPDNMNFIGVIEINGIEQATEIFELGAFCGDECRGSEMLTFYEGLDRYMVFMTVYGQSGHVLSFKLFDHSSQQELELAPPETIQFVANDVMGAINDPYVFSFSGGSGMITASAVPEEGGTVTGVGGYWIGETCTLEATANEGYTFVDWTENGQQVSLEPTFSLLVTTDHDLQANFSINSYDITIEAQPDDGGVVSGGGSYSFGATATVSAAPHAHYEFVNWTEDGVVVSTTAEYTFVVESNRHLVATFVQETFEVKATVYPENAGAVEGMGTYTFGETATLIAHPNGDYEFVEWREEGAFVSDQSSISFVVTQSRNLEAHFIYYDGVGEEETTLSVSPNPTSGIVAIKGVQEDCIIHLMDENGHVVLTKKTEETETVLDLSQLPDGCYTLIVLSKEERCFGKLIKASR